MRPTLVFAIALMGLAPSPAAEGAPDPEAVKATAREYVKLFYAADLQPVHDKFTDEMKGTMPFEDLQEMRRTVGLQLGDESELLDERIESRDGYVTYVRRARFTKYKGEVESQWVLRDGRIAGVQFRPASAPGAPR
jgi:hypothetical protein